MLDSLTDDDLSADIEMGKEHRKMVMDGIRQLQNNKKPADISP